MANMGKLYLLRNLAGTKDVKQFSIIYWIMITNIAFGNSGKIADQVRHKVVYII